MSSGPDLTTAVLSDGQRGALQDFKGLTGLESDSQCVRILEANEWDLQRAVRVALGEHLEAKTAPPPTAETRHRRVRQDDDDTNSPAESPRQGLLSNQQQRPMPPAAAVQSRNCCSKFWVTLLRFFGFGPAVDDEKNLSASERFIRDFETDYGASHPQFFVGTFSHALNSANRASKMVFIYLHSEDHDDTDAFCRNSLSKPEIVQFIDGHCIAYGASVKDYGNLCLFLLCRSFRFLRGISFVTLAQG
jgi:FAS-associated factor 2